MALSDKEIITVIKEYIADDRQKQAILLDGEWGSGKTFFVKEVLVPEISEKLTLLKLSTEVLYVSLYGLDTTEKIMNEIYKSLAESMFTVKKALLSSDSSKPPILNKGKLAVKIFSGITSAALSAIPIELPEIKADDFLNIEKLTIIFDDLERCASPINETLGFINSLVEHNGVKAIIVGCEDEITGENKIFKPNKATSQDDEATSEKNKKVDHTTQSEIDGKSIAYKNIKEKLIGLTIAYKPDFTKVFSSAMEIQCTVPETKLLIENVKTEITDIFQEKNHNNIRTFLFILSKFESIQKIIEKTVPDNATTRSAIRKTLLYYTLVLSIEYKKNLTMDYDENIWNRIELRQKATEFSGIQSVFLHDFDYSFILEYITTGYLDTAKASEAVKESADALSNYENHLEKPLSIEALNDYFLLEQEEIPALLRTLKQELHENKYGTGGLHSLCNILPYLKSIDVYASEINDIIPDLQSNITYVLKKQNFSETVDRLTIGLLRNPIIQDFFDEVVSPLIEESEGEERYKLQDIISLFETRQEDWGEDFDKLCRENKNLISSNHRFMADLDVDLLENRLSVAKNKDIVHFMWGVGSVYRFSNLNEYFTDDLPNLENLVAKVDSFANSNEGLKKDAFQRLSAVLREKIDIIKK